MCEPVSLAMGAMNAVGQIGQHRAEGKAVSARNRAKLRNFKMQNAQYLDEVMLDNNQYKNDVQIQDIEQDEVYQAMVDQWTQQDMQLDRLFAEGDQKIMNAITEMYENEYVGTGTGVTAARLAGKGARKLGQYKAETLHKLMLAEEETYTAKEHASTRAEADSRKLYEKVRFAPIHGPTPMQPQLEAQPGKAGLILGLASTALGTAMQAGVFKAPSIGDKTVLKDFKMDDPSTKWATQSFGGRSQSWAGYSPFLK